MIECFPGQRSVGAKLKIQYFRKFANVCFKLIYFIELGCTVDKIEI